MLVCIHAIVKNSYRNLRIIIVNRIPIPNYCTASTTMDYPVLVPVTATDPDGHGMLITVDTLPTLGKLYVSNSSRVLIQQGVTYSLPDGLNGNDYFYYKPDAKTSKTDTFR